jgi:hypothetical protein
MKIISNFKDYYDYIEFLYSPEGGDERLRFFRSKIDKTKDGNEGLTVELSERIRSIPDIPYKDKYYANGNMSKFPWVLKWCVVNGKYYLLVADAVLDSLGGYCKSEAAYLGFKPYKLLRQDHPAFSHLACTGHWFRASSERLKEVDIVGVPSDTLTELSKEIGSPIFSIRGWTNGKSVTVDNQIPNLGHLGFAALTPPEQMYQELAMYYGNVMRDSPDNSPPITVSDKDRLIQKGFDSKLSFRGKTK